MCEEVRFGRGGGGGGSWKKPPETTTRHPHQSGQRSEMIFSFHDLSGSLRGGLIEAGSPLTLPCQCT